MCIHVGKDKKGGKVHSSAALYTFEQYSKIYNVQICKSGIQIVTYIYSVVYCT